MRVVCTDFHKILDEASHWQAGQKTISSWNPKKWHVGSKVVSVTFDFDLIYYCHMY